MSEYPRTPLLNRNGQPQVFTFFAWQWDVNRAARIMEQRKLRPVKIPTSSVSTMLNMIRVNERHADTVSLNLPIFIVKMPFDLGYLCIDGWHRIWKANRDNVEELSAVFFDEEDEAKIRLNEIPNPDAGHAG